MNHGGKHFEFSGTSLCGDMAPGLCTEYPSNQVKFINLGSKKLLYSAKIICTRKGGIVEAESEWLQYQPTAYASRTVTRIRTRALGQSDHYAPLVNEDF